MRPPWCPDLRDGKVIVVASGPSAAGVPLIEARDAARFVAINESWRLCPWADVLYACDGSWWKKRNGVPEFGGVRVSQDAAAHQRFPDVQHVKCRRGVHRILTDASGEIGDGRTSLFQAINVVVRAGPPRAIGLVGADMTLDYGIHWHGPHEDGLNNPRPKSVLRWIEALDGVADELARLGIEVLNLSAISALTRYRKVTLQEFIAL